MDNIVLQQELKRIMRVSGVSLLVARQRLVDSVDVAVDEVREELTEE